MGHAMSLILEEPQAARFGAVIVAAVVAEQQLPHIGKQLVVRQSQSLGLAQPVPRTTGCNRTQALVHALQHGLLEH